MMSQPSPISLSKRFLVEDSRGRAGSDPTSYVFAKRRQERVSLLWLTKIMGVPDPCMSSILRFS